MQQFKTVADIDEEYGLNFCQYARNNSYHTFILKIFNNGKVKYRKKYKRDPLLLNTIALMYDVKKKDMSSAIKYYKMSIVHNDVDSMYCLGTLYEDENDLHNAIKYYKMAADNGDNDSACDIVRLCSKARDMDIVKQYCELAFNKNISRNLIILKNSMSNLKLFNILILSKNETDEIKMDRFVNAALLSI